MPFLPLLWLFITAGCGDPPHSATSPPVASAPQEIAVEPARSSPLHEVPELPPHTVLQVFYRDTGHLERFMDDGRWLVQVPGGELTPQAPKSAYEPDRDVLSADALRRIREKLDEVGFFELPARVEGTMPGPGGLLTGGQGVPQAQVYVLSAFDGSGAQRSVELEGEIRAFGTFGALQPVMESLDREAWGRWIYE